jgi:tetratricopeptide (TPR) repeat protein
VDNVLQTQSNIQPISTFSTQQWQATAALGADILPGLGLGLLMKGVQEQIANYQGEGVGLDAGLVYRLASTPDDYCKLGLSNLTVGLAVANLISPQVTLYQTADQPVEIYKAGLGFRYDISPAGDRFWLVLEGDMPQGAGNVVEAGAEYAFQNTFFARVGYDGVSPTAGAGVSYGGFELDYAYNQRDLGTLNRFSLSYRFGEYLDPVIAQKKDLENQKLEMLKWVARSYEKDEDFDAAIKAWGKVLKDYPRDAESPKAIQNLKERRQKQVEILLQQARPAMKNRDFGKGIPLLGKVLALDPSNTEARRLLKQVDQGRELESAYLSGVEAYRHENYREAADDLGGVYEANQDYRDVAFLYRDAQSRIQPLESLPKDLSELYAKGVDFYLKGQYAQAISVWERVLAKVPGNRLVARNLEEARTQLHESMTPSPAKRNP